MSSPQYELFVNIIGIFNILCIVVRQVDITDDTKFIRGWIVVQLIINTIFLLEMISDIFIYGIFNSYVHNFRMTPETICQFYNFLAISYFFNQDSESEYNTVVKLLEVVIFVRMIKLLTLLYEIKTMRIIIETMRKLLSPLAEFGGVLFTIFWVFCLVGMLLFGGKVQKNLDVI